MLSLIGRHESLILVREVLQDLEKGDKGEKENTEGGEKVRAEVDGSGWAFSFIVDFVEGFLGPFKE